MKSINSLLLPALAAMPSMAAAKSVFAHVIMGNVCSYSTDSWTSDIKLAQGVGIDAFVLNIAPPLQSGNCLETQMSNAFIAANALATDFKLFFSFDYLGGGQPWASSDVITILEEYGPNYAHFKYGPSSYPLVSTFEGTDNINDWPGIRSAVGGIYFIPDWTSLGPDGFASYLDIVDGAFSWDMWPDGPNDISDSNDAAWKSMLGGKSFMMGVSPWFYTDLPSYNKAWVWRGDDMWHERWQQTLDIEPDFVEIVTWNDYGESHYIGPIVSDGVPSGDGTDAHVYVDNMPHDNWRDFVPFYAAQYKNGGATAGADKLQYWYRLTPGAAGSNGGVTGNDCPSAINIYGYQTCYDPNAVSQDKVFVSALLTSAASVTVQIGGGAVSTFSGAAGVNHWSVDFDGQTGAVVFKIVRNGATVVSGTGEAISASPASGQTNYNAWVGGAS